MATKYANLKGKLKWAKVYEPDDYAGAQNWKVSFYPSNEDEWEKFRQTGLQLKVKEDTDGKYIQFRRPTKKMIKEDLVIFSPPELTGKVSVSYVDAEGNRQRQYNKGEGKAPERVGEPVLIGNGTLAIVNISYYTTIKGPGHRLESLNILDLVEYDGPSEEVVQEDDPKPVEKKTSKKDDLDDEIPF